MSENNNQNKDKHRDKYIDKNSNNKIKNGDCPKKDKDGNCLVPGVYSDSDPIGGG